MYNVKFISRAAQFVLVFSMWQKYGLRRKGRISKVRRKMIASKRMESTNGQAIIHEKPRVLQDF